MATTYRGFRRAAERFVLGPEGEHHRFANGKHGRQLDFGAIKEGTDLYDCWVRVQAGSIHNRQLYLPEVVLVGAAAGTNRLARDVAALLGMNHLTTTEVSPGAVVLDDASAQRISEISFRRAIVIDDVGVTGDTALMAAESTRYSSQNPDIDIDALFSWIRNDRLHALDDADVCYRALVHDPMPMYPAELCVEMGYCALGWEIIPLTEPVQST